MDELKKKERISIMEILGRHIEKYINIFIFVVGLISLFEVFCIIYWNIDDSTYGYFSDHMYLVSYIFLLCISLASLVSMILNKKKIVSTFLLSIFLYIYAFLIFLWATMIAVLDLDSGISPLVYLTICMFVSGILVIEPIFFTFLALGSLSVILIFNGINHYPYFKGDGEIFNLILYMILVVILAYRHYNVTIKEARTQDRLEQLTYYDDLTGLLNERSYFMEIDKLNKEIAEGKKPKFGIAVMDVNNLKATNDAYGHRFGSHLIKRGGQTLLTVFKTSKVYHVGGDEFIAIIYGDDFDNIEDVIKRFDEELRYKLITFENKELIFSIARGYAIYDGKENYKSTFQVADQNMYENKLAIKAEYKMKGR